MKEYKTENLSMLNLSFYWLLMKDHEIDFLQHAHFS